MVVRTVVVYTPPVSDLSARVLEMPDSRNAGVLQTSVADHAKTHYVAKTSDKLSVTCSHMSVILCVTTTHNMTMNLLTGREGQT